MRLKVIGFLIVLVFIGALEGNSQELQQETSPEEFEQEIIPLNEINNRANELSLYLEELFYNLIDEKQFHELDSIVLPLIDSIDILLPGDLKVFVSDLDYRNVNASNQQWMLYQAKLIKVQQEVTTRVEKLEEEAQFLREETIKWNSIKEQLEEPDVPETLQNRVDEVLNELGGIQKKLITKRSEVLILQEDISSRTFRVKRLLSLLEEREKEQFRHIFVRDNPPLIKAFSTSRDSMVYNLNVSGTWKGMMKANRVFIKENTVELRWWMILFLTLILYLFYLRNRIRKDKIIIKSKAHTKLKLHFLYQPVLSAAMIAILLINWIFSYKTSDFIHMMVIISILPTSLLIYTMVDKKYQWVAYAVMAITLLDYFRAFANQDPLFQRVALLISAILLLGALAVLFLTAQKDKSEFLINPRAILIFNLNPVFFIILALSILANIYGTVAFSQRLYLGVSRGLFGAFVFSFIDIILDGLVSIIFRKERYAAYDRVSLYAPRIEKTVQRIVNFLILFYWLRFTLNGFGLYEPILRLLQSALDLSWKVGETTISVNTIFKFVFILVGSSILARALRIILDLEVFSRIKTPRGIPGAVTMVIRYTVVGFGFFLALSSIGVDLGKFGLLTGAIGVGLGFGLQNVIANFVSGIIISFERPMQVGDLVEIKNIMGNVEEIGVRSSTVRTFDGSEVIVPNHDFISQEFINWTLSDPKRRVKQKVKVAFGSNPHEVVEILKNVMDQHPGVHKEPAPEATYDGFGDYYLEFTMYYFISENLLRNRSEVALRVYDAIVTSGIEVPIPVQNLNVKMNDPEE